MTPEQKQELHLNDALVCLVAASKVRTGAGGELVSLAMAKFYVKDAIAELEKEMDDGG